MIFILHIFKFNINRWLLVLFKKKRFTNEVRILKDEPLHYITAYPDEQNPLVWYFLIYGQEETPYHMGQYIGKIVHSVKYPVEPPDYYMLTPSGRYEINRKICLTNSSYHKADWSSTWNIRTILIGFYSIFLDDSAHGISHIHKSKEERIQLAKESLEYNSNNNADVYQKFDKTHLTHIFKKELKPEVENLNENLNENTDLKNVKININEIDSIINKINNSLKEQHDEIKELEKIVFAPNL